MKQTFTIRSVTNKEESEKIYEIINEERHF